MNTLDTQINFIQNWGFKHLISDLWYREEFDGWLEQWTEKNPNTIQFFVKKEKGITEYSHDYKIDWNLFIK